MLLESRTCQEAVLLKLGTQHCWITWVPAWNSSLDSMKKHTGNSRSEAAGKLRRKCEGQGYKLTKLDLQFSAADKRWKACKKTWGLLDHSKLILKKRKSHRRWIMTSIQTSPLRLSEWYLVPTGRDDLLIHWKLKAEIGKQLQLKKKSYSSNTAHAEYSEGALEWRRKNALKICRESFNQFLYHGLEGSQYFDSYFC